MRDMCFNYNGCALNIDNHTHNEHILLDRILLVYCLCKNPLNSVNVSILVHVAFQMYHCEMATWVVTLINTICSVDFEGLVTFPRTQLH